MINITDKTKCVGCWGCYQVCPSKCIEMKMDEEGFFYPEIDNNKCTDCGVCESVCPTLCSNEIGTPLKKYAAKNRDQLVREGSSSGGVFTLLAEWIIEQDGVVFGAVFNAEWEVVHTFVQAKEDLIKFRGSKYVQSKIGDSYIRAKEFLKKGKQVLFSGTPCQIAGLRLFLKKEYENLILVDLICHGVPSGGVWELYKKQTFVNEQIKNISFRDKTSGWKMFSLRIETDQRTLCENMCTNPYLVGFLHDLYLRPSCHSCPVKSFKSKSDITLADFWSIRKYLPLFEDKRGVSLVTTNTVKGNAIYSKLLLETIEVPDVPLQLMSYESVKPHINRNEFFEKYITTTSFKTLVEELTYVSPLRNQIIRIGVLAKIIIKKILRIR